MEIIPLIIAAAISGGTSLLFAVLGGILNEKAGVINFRNRRHYVNRCSNVSDSFYSNK